jgi:hypothetical protein
MSYRRVNVPVAHFVERLGCSIADSVADATTNLSSMERDRRRHKREAD